MSYRGEMSGCEYIAFSIACSSCMAAALSWHITSVTKVCPGLSALALVFSKIEQILG